MSNPKISDGQRRDEEMLVRFVTGQPGNEEWEKEFLDVKNLADQPVEVAVLREQLRDCWRLISTYEKGEAASEARIEHANKIVDLWLRRERAYWYRPLPETPTGQLGEFAKGVYQADLAGNGVTKTPRDRADILFIALVDARRRLATCGACGTLFIRKGSRGDYCSAKCVNEVQKKHKRNWWNLKKSVLREKAGKKQKRRHAKAA